MSDNIPQPRYKLTFELTANDIDKLANEFEMAADGFALKVMSGRTTMDLVSGAGYILKVVEQNPEMTEERYRKELNEWAMQRKK